MYVPLPFVAATVVLLLVLALLAFRRRGGDMLEDQRREARSRAVPSAELRALLDRPDIAEAIAQGRKIEAIRLVRERSGLGLKEAKELVERR